MENNKENGRIGCRGGDNRTKIIDPNDFNGFNSSTNISVPLEDLNISVILKTKKKSRTVLTTTEKEGSVAKSSRDVRINFISGTDIKGTDGTKDVNQKIVTTRYTDLTTIFEKGTVNTETLGITNIDIDFNSSYAPQITINFVDVRGSSIFQNEGGIAAENSVNPYSTLFQIPYPIFELEIKGYYGKPVTYCLHMIKFNSKFNSQTGNFEMQCEFVGYTYAMLSDLLIGYLKVISLTTIGKDKYALYNGNKDSTKATPVLTLHELVIKLQSLNEGLEKGASDSANSVGSVNCDKGITYLANLGEIINTFGNTISSKLKSEDVEIDKFTYIPIASIDKIPDIAVTEYNKSIDDTVKLFNELNLGTTLNVTDFKNLTVYTNVKLSYFDKNKTANDATLISKAGKQDNLIKFKDDIFRFLGDNFNLAKNSSLTEPEINLYNMNSLFSKLTEIKTFLENKNQDFKKALATELSDKVTSQLNFSPTVRNIVEIYTAASEVFLETIYQVSTDAEKKDNTKRINQLKSKFKFKENSDLPSIASDSTFFAWPAYKEKDTKEVFVEKYLGDPTVGLEHPEDIDEVKFIENLFKAFIIAAQEEANAQRELDNQTKLWLPINPLDTKLFTPTDPYGRNELNSYLDVVRLATIRGMTFLGYTNDGTTLTDKEIIAMAEAEADNIVRGVSKKVLEPLIPKITEVNTASTGTTPTKAYSKTLDLYRTITGNINSAETKVVIANDARTGYFYNYIYDIILPNFNTTNNANNNFDLTKTENYKNLTTINPNKFKSVIPISDRFQGNWPKTNAELLNLHNNEGLVFLTNYSHISKFPKEKFDDGGTYIKIFNLSEFKSITNEIVLNELPQNATGENILIQKQLELPRAKIFKTPETTGLNVLGGPMGIQEYVTIKDETGDVQLMNIFYSNDFTKQTTGLANSRNITLPAKFKDAATKYDIKTSLPRKFGTQKDYYKTSDSETAQILHSSQGHNRNFLNFQTNIDNLFENVSYPYFEQPIFDYNLFKIIGPVRKPFDNSAFSLFGSKLYYAQKTDYAKAFLFLNNLPFNKGVETGSPFENNEIINLFNMRGGFIHAPMLWCAWVGSILWRRDESKPLPENGRLIGGGNDKGEANDPIKWFFNGTSAPKDDSYVDGSTTKFKSHPNRNQYLTCVNVNAPNLKIDFSSILQDDILVNLPYQVEYEFKRIFFDFVKIDGGLSVWDTLRDSLEIWTSTSTSFNKYVDDFNRLAKNSVDANTFNFSEPPTNSLKNEKNYSIIAPVVYPGGLYSFNDYLFLELYKNGKDNVAIGNLITAMRDEVVIANTGFKIWENPFTEDVKPKTGEQHSLIFVSNENFNLYFKSLNNKLVASGVGMGDVAQKKEIVNSIFGTTNESIIKLNLYKHCKNIYDKWIGGTTDVKEIMFQCGVNKRNSTDGGLALKYGNKNSKFIDSFRFVSRSFRDIGNLLYINPIPINDYLTENQNASIYDSISSILASNNFDFIALPTFINFHDDEELKAVFKPYGNYGEVIKEGSCGPTFVCVYTGEKSKHLAIVDADYPNDGFDLRCTKAPTTASDNGNANQKAGTLLNTIPSDFGSNPTDSSKAQDNINKFEDPIGVFTVKYSQQNQNIFKDISLDQSEFTETEESIKIMDDISQKGAETNRTLAGQNLYGVYSVRSYKAEVEMMGNAMIQPMMYFQLDNIPMFHGAYMITRVKHSIKPNYMSTNFTGVRIKYSETPLITAQDVYMSLIDTLDLSAAVDTSAGNVRGNGLSAADLANIKTVKCNAVGKTVVTFIEVLRAVVAYLEGNYCGGGTKCGDKPNNIRSGETLWGLDRKNHQGKLDNAFWSKADSYNKGKWGQSYPTPFTEETKPLFELYTPIFKKEYDSFSKRYFTNPAVKTLVESDGRLFFNLVYTVYNGQAYFKGMVKLMESEYAKGKKTADALLQSVINDRVSGLQQTFFLGTNHKLGQDGVTKLARTGIKIEKLVGLATSCK